MSTTTNATTSPAPLLERHLFKMEGSETGNALEQHVYQNILDRLEAIQDDFSAAWVVHHSQYLKGFVRALFWVSSISLDTLNILENKNQEVTDLALAKLKAKGGQS